MIVWSHKMSNREAKTTLYLVRHGETDWNKQGLIQGQQDIQLNQTGRQQAEKLQPFFQSHEVDHYYSSDLKRAHETGVIATESMSIQIQQDNGLRERCFGKYETHTRKYIRETWDPDFFHKSKGEPDGPIEGAEGILDFQKRSVDTISKIAVRHSGQRLAIFTHGGVIRSWLSYWLQIPMTLPRRFEVKNTSIHICFSDPEISWIIDSIGVTQDENSPILS